MKKKIYILLITIAAVFLLQGCGESADRKTEKNTSQMAESSGQTDAGQETVVNVAEIEVREVSEREWEDKAVITLGSLAEIDGSGAAVQENVIVISEGGAYEITGSLEDGMIYIETADAVKLILNDASITNSSGPAIYSYDAQELWIETAEGTMNTLNDGNEYTGVFVQETTGDDTQIGKGTIFSNDDLIFWGKGTLTVNGNYNHAICSDDSVYFQSGSYVLTALADGVHVNDAIVVNDGAIQAAQVNDGMESEGIIIFNNGSYTADVADDGMTAAGDLTVNGGTITITACEEGMEAKGNFCVNEGTIQITGNDDGINGGTLVQINGGMIYINMTTGDGMDSNGNLELNGGTVITLGGSAPEGGADCDANKFIISGGLLIAAGGENSSPAETDSAQASVLLGAANAGDAIGILDAEGNTVFSFQVTKSYSNLLLSGGFLKENETYTVYTGGSITGSETCKGYYAESSYEGGTQSVAFTVDGMVVSAGGTAGMQGGMGGGKQGRGQLPENGEMPGNGQLPENGEMPGNGQLPEGMEPPTDSQMPQDSVPQGDDGTL